jgi:hypothetical protein
MRCEPDIYREDIASLNLTREQEDELLQTLWEMMRTMVEIGWGVDTINRLLPELFDKTGQRPEYLPD